MSNNSRDPSIKSPASSCHSLTTNNKLPPPFTHSLATTLNDPPSFILSTALTKVDQPYPSVLLGIATQIFNATWASYGPNNQPLSIQEAKDLLLEQEDLSNTIHTTTYSLVSTINHHTLQHNQQLRGAKQQILAQHNLMAQHNKE